MAKKITASTITAIVLLLGLAACNENVPGDPDYYSCQYFGTHCHKGKK